MRWLTRLHHCVIRRIDDVINAPHPDCFQPFFHPLRAWPNRHILNHPRRISPAQIRLSYLNRAQLINVPVRLIELHNRHLQFLTRRRRKFPGHSDITEAIPAITRYLQIYNRIVTDMLDAFIRKTDIAENFRYFFRRQRSFDIIT